MNPNPPDYIFTPLAVFTLALPPRFDLPRAVCSYGYFILAPNRWDPVTRLFQRPLHASEDRLLTVTLWQERRRLKVAHDAAINPLERSRLTTQIRRMLRLDEPPELFRDFQRKLPGARRDNFGRLFHSPTLFEDIVKTITTCNVTWPSTMRMNTLLCQHPGRGGFPTPTQLASLTPAQLKRRCGVGYRADRIVRLARDVASGRLDLARFEDRARSTQDIFDDLLTIHGIGPYAAANLCQLLGRYDRLPIDSETYRHFRITHKISTPRNPLKLHRRIERHYARFAPYQFLAYWHELWGDYQSHAGDAQQWEAAQHGPTFTAARLKK